MHVLSRHLAAFALLGVVFTPSLLGQSSASEELFDQADAASKRYLEAHPEIEYLPDRVLVQFHEFVPASQRTQIRQAISGWAHKALSPGLEAIHVRMNVVQALDLLNGLEAVEFAEPDYIQRKANTPNDEFYSLQYGVHNTGQTIQGSPGIADADIDGPEAWDVSTGDANFAVAIIDTGTQWNHPDLDGNVWANPGEIAGNGVDDDGNGYVDDVRGWDFYSNDSNPDDSDGHGTHTAGTVGAEGNNSIGVTGVNWQCDLMVLRFLGPFGGSTTDAILSVNYAAANGAKVSNNSWGGGGFSQGLYNAIADSAGDGHLFVAAAGNNNGNNDSSAFYPASYNLDNILSVAATDNRDNRASFSNYGATTVDLGAPGVDIASTWTGSGYVYLSGTSMACPHTAGVAALVYAQNPGWNQSDVKGQLMSTTRAVSSMQGITVTGGVVNAADALGGGGGPGNTPPSVNISSPSNGSSVIEGTSVTFTGSATDAEDGDLSASLTWTSSLQGTIGSGASFSRSDLAVGTHTITASVNDSNGAGGSDSVTLTIEPDPGSSPPNAPSNLSAQVFNGGVRLTWSDNSNNEDGFFVQRERRHRGSWIDEGTTDIGNPDVTLYDDSNVSRRTRYRYRIQAYNAIGSSAWTGWVEIRVK